MKAPYLIGALGMCKMLVQRRFMYRFRDTAGGRILRDAKPEEGTTDKPWCPLNRATRETPSVSSSIATPAVAGTPAEVAPLKKKRGRPKGSKNKRGKDGGETKIKERVG